MKILKKVFPAIICLIVLNLHGQHPAKFVWNDHHLNERQDFARFRYDFTLESIPGKANLNLYVDSRYHLFVNGMFLNFGPARSYPVNWEYDTIDLAPYLREGKNSIVVLAFSNGVYTFQQPLSQAGFIAWGTIEDGAKTIDLSTPGNWKCDDFKGYNNDAPRFSFASGPIEVVDGSMIENGWTKVDYNSSGWNSPVTIKDQSHWGSPRPRTIPYLTNEKWVPKELKGMYHLTNDQDIYSFRLVTEDRTRDDFNATRKAFAYTYIYSPEKQKVKAGLWWGEYWLNGNRLERIQPEDDTRNNYNYTMLDLNKGWNYLFVSYGVVWSHWEFYFQVPKKAGLKFSPGMNENDELIFKTAGPFCKSDLAMIDTMQIPLVSPGMLEPLSANWEGKSMPAVPVNPAWNVAWAQMGEKTNMPASRVYDINLQQPDNKSMVFDMGGKVLGRIFVEYEAKEGAVVDIAFSEDMKGNKINILKRPGIYSAARHIAKEGVNYFETFKPYGLRYLQLIFHNAGEEMKIKRIGVIRQEYPFEKAGNFECSDPMYNAIWDMAWRTLRVCSEDTYTDTPYRERGTYAGDALPQFAITLATSGDEQLLKRTLYYFQDHYRSLFYPDEFAIDKRDSIHSFPLITLVLYGWYVERTNDLEFARELYPSYKRMIDDALLLRQENGLIANSRSFIEWTGIDKKANLTTVQALFARGLEIISETAGTLGYERDASKYNLLAIEMKQIIRDKCWDNEKGAFRDGYSKSGDPLDSYYIASSAWPQVFNVSTAPQDEALKEFYDRELDSIGDYSRKRKITPYGSFYLLGSLYRHNQEALAEDFIRKHWSPMVIKYDDTAWENFDDGTGKDGGQGTLSHAWSGGPAYYMTTDILGVRLGFPEKVEMDKIVISPVADKITWARGIVPHPKGMIEVEWRVQDDNLFIHYSVPGGTTAVVHPRGKLANLKLWVNGKQQFQ